MKLENFIINTNDTIIDALKKIDYNRKGFLIVVDNIEVVGTLTDGDLRRAFISGKITTNNILDVYNKNFIFISINDDFYKIINIFKDESTDFLPILDKEHKLLNIITKKNMHSLLLQDIKFDFTYNFLEIDDSLMEHEIYLKPWGFYKTAILNPYFQSKTIKVSPNGTISLQEHNKREEHWIVVHGEGKAQIGESILTIRAGSYLFIPKACKHRLMNTSTEESLTIVEVQLGNYFGEDDILRYEDNYGRV